MENASNDDWLEKMIKKSELPQRNKGRVSLNKSNYRKKYTTKKPDFHSPEIDGRSIKSDPKVDKVIKNIWREIEKCKRKDINLTRFLNDLGKEEQNSMQEDRGDVGFERASDKLWQYNYPFGKHLWQNGISECPLGVCNEEQIETVFRRTTYDLKSPYMRKISHSSFIQDKGWISNVNSDRYSLHSRNVQTNRNFFYDLGEINRSSQSSDNERNSLISNGNYYMEERTISSGEKGPFSNTNDTKKSESDSNTNENVQKQKILQNVSVNTDFINNSVYNFKADDEYYEERSPKSCTVQHLPKLNIGPKLETQVNSNVSITTNFKRKTSPPRSSRPTPAKGKNYTEYDKKTLGRLHSEARIRKYKSEKNLELRLSRIEKLFEVDKTFEEMIAAYPNTRESQSIATI